MAVSERQMKPEVIFWLSKRFLGMFRYTLTLYHIDQEFQGQTRQRGSPRSISAGGVAYLLIYDL